MKCIPLKDKSSQELRKQLICNWITRYGVPSRVVNDNENTLISSTMKQMYAYLGVKMVQIAPYHPEGNAVIESFHRTLNKGLQSFIQDELTNVSFEEALALLMYSYRSTIHLTSNETPAFLTFGQDLRPPRDNDWRMMIPEERTRTRKEQRNNTKPKVPRYGG